MLILVDHFTVAGTALKIQLQETLTQMNHWMDQASPTELIGHQRFLSATIKNVQAEAVWRQKEANKKLNHLRGGVDHIFFSGGFGEKKS